jgi:diacylglycerol kinase (ATP)
VTAPKGRMLAISNPSASGGGYRRDMPRIMEALNALGYEVDARHTTAPGDATAFARQAVTQSFELVCAIGGDGTVNETVNGLAGSGVPLAIVPTGTVNVLAMELGIPLDPPDAVRVIERGSLSWIDLGLAG